MVQLFAALSADVAGLVQDNVLEVLGDAEEHADNTQRHDCAEMLHEVDLISADEGVEAARGELADQRLDGIHLAWRERTGEQIAADVVDRGVFEDQGAGRNLDVGLQNLDHHSPCGAEGLVVDQRMVDIVEPAQRVEVVFGVVVERCSVSQPLEHRVRVGVEVDIPRVVVIRRASHCRCLGSHFGSSVIVEFSQSVDLLEVVLKRVVDESGGKCRGAARGQGLESVPGRLWLPHRIERFIGGHDHLEIGRQFKGFQPLGRGLDRDVDTGTSRRRA